MHRKTLSAEAAFMAGGGEMGKLMRETNWSNTALGPIDGWPQSLRTSVSTCLNARFPILILWGRDMVMFYNDAFRPILGAKNHPAVMGHKGKECWPAMWSIIEPMLEGVLNRGEATLLENQMLPLDRNGNVEECFFTFSSIPIHSDNSIGGILTALYETTQQVLAQRRLDLLMRSPVNAQLRHVFDQTPAAIAIISRRNYLLEFANESYLRIINRTSECIGNPLFEVLPQLSNQGIRALLDKVMQTGEPHLGTEFAVDLHGNGKAHPTYFNFIYHPLKEEEGRITGVIVVCFNVTDLVASRKRAEESELLLEQKVKERTAELEVSHEAMRQQRDFGEKILNSSIDNICVLDRDLRYIAFNDKCQETYKINRQDVLGKRVVDVFPKLSESTFVVAIQKALTGVHVHQQEYQSVVTGRHFEVNYIPLKDQWQKVYAVLVIAHDNTDAMEAARALEEKNDQLSRTNRELERFAYIASHDLQEPLRKIRTFSSMIERELPPDFVATKYFGKIHASSARMSTLIKDLLDYSRLSGAEITPESVNLADVIRNVISDYELLIEEVGAVIACDKLPVITGIPLQLHQLFSNLIGNSLKFTRNEPVIEVSSRVVPHVEMKGYFTQCEAREYAEVMVRDNGIGFDQKFSEQIFTIFQRLHDRQVSGTGIGLAICRKIVENHNGFIRAEGKIGEGAAFYVYLPME